MRVCADMLDDEVAESVFRSRGVSLDMDAVTLLNGDNFHAAVAQHSHTVALFYLKCEKTPDTPGTKKTNKQIYVEFLLRGPLLKTYFLLGEVGVDVSQFPKYEKLAEIQKF